jgi:hypothetical protein
MDHRVWASEPPKKIDLLRHYMAAGKWDAAIKLAAGFGELGAERAAILSGREALLRPDFQRQLGKQPDELVEAAKAALLRRYAARA